MSNSHNHDQTYTTPTYVQKRIDASNMSMMRDNLGAFPGIIRPTLNLHAGLVSNDDCPLGTFTRSAPKWRLGPTGLLESVAADKVAREWDANGNLLGWLIEEQRTNPVVYNTDISNLSWTKEYSPTIVSGQPDIFGGTTACSLTKSSGTFSIVRRVINIESDTLPVVAKFYIKKLAGGYYRLLLADTATWTLAFGVYYSADTQTISSTFGSLLSSSVKDGPAGYKIIEFSFNNLSAASWAVDMWAYTQSAPDIIGGVQVERGAFSTSFIKTEGSPVTRPADVWTIPTSAFPFNFCGEGAVYFCGDIPVLTTGYHILFNIDDGTISNRVLGVAHGAANSYVSHIYNGIDQATLILGSLITSGNRLRLCDSWSANAFASSVNGGTNITDTSGYTPSGQTRFIIGSDSVLGYNILNGHLYHLAYFPHPLSAANNQAITS